MADEKKYRIIFEKDKCIGAAACNSVSDSWEFNDEENKSNLIRGEFNPEKNIYEIEKFGKEFDRDFNAARLCPVKAIHIEDKDGKRLI